MLPSEGPGGVNVASNDDDRELGLGAFLDKGSISLYWKAGASLPSKVNPFGWKAETSPPSGD